MIEAAENQTPAHSTTADLKAEKQRLGPLEQPVFKAATMKEAHKMLGIEVSAQARRIFAREVNAALEAGDLLNKLNYSKECLLKMKEKLNDQTIDKDIRAALSEYFDSLKSWGEGVELVDELNTITDVPLSELQTLTQGIDTISLNELLAFWKQNDNQGCQTGMTRSADGKKVRIRHTEEDAEDVPGERVDKVRCARFEIGPENNAEVRYSFIYPDLLPGPGFGFGKNFLYAVDFQHVKQRPEPASLANVATWVCWRLGEKTDPHEVVKALGPYVDGYTLNTLRKLSTPDGAIHIEAKKIEFAHETTVVYELAEKPNSTMVAVNLFGPDSKLARESEEIAAEDKTIYEKRIQRALQLERIMRGVTSPAQGVTPIELTLPAMRLMLASQVGNKPDEYGNVDYGHANKDVKAYVVAEMSVDGIELLVDSGAALKDDVPTKINF